MSLVEDASGKQFNTQVRLLTWPSDTWKKKEIKDEKV